MLARPFRFLAPVLAALSLVVLRVACPSAAQAGAAPAGVPEDGRVVFRHYL